MKLAVMAGVAALVLAGCASSERVYELEHKVMKLEKHNAEEHQAVIDQQAADKEYLKQKIEDVKQHVKDVRQDIDGHVESHGERG